MIRALLILVLVLPLGGCATFTAAALGTAVAIGAVSGLGKFAGERGLNYARADHLIRKKCSHLKTDLYRKRCTNRLRYILHQYRS